MKKMLGLCCFCVAAGIFLMLFIDNTFVAIIFIAILLLLGFNLFSCGC